jgi:hypothetical protein
MPKIIDVSDEIETIKPDPKRPEILPDGTIKYPVRITVRNVTFIHRGEVYTISIEVEKGKDLTEEQVKAAVDEYIKKLKPKHPLVGLEW